MQRGTQIIYVPAHADGDVNHLDSQAGFVWRWVGDGTAFCRYWSRFDNDLLQMGIDSERCDVVNLVVRKSVPDEQVEKWVRILEAKEGPVDVGEKRE